MLDDSLGLQEDPHLLALLTHYAQQGTEDRATWRDRLMQMEGVEPKQLSVLHGELIVSDWVEQNTGQAIMLADGRLTACYRITPSGLREYGRLHGVKIEEKVLETPEKKGPKFPRKKKQEGDSIEAPAVAAAEKPPEMTERPQESDSIEAPVVAASEGSPETPEEMGPKFLRSDLPEAPVGAASEGSPETPEKKGPKFARKKKQKSDSPEAVVVAASEEPLAPAA